MDNEVVEYGGIKVGDQYTFDRKGVGTIEKIFERQQSRYTKKEFGWARIRFRDNSSLDDTIEHILDNARIIKR